MKIFLTGNAGCGKSTFGKKLSKDIKLPLYGLDKIVWKPGWVPTPKAERAQLIDSLISRKEWIIEGVSKQVLEAADRVVFLDIPLWRCLLNILKRFVLNGFGTRADLPQNCPEYVGVFKAMRIAFVFQKETRPWLVGEVDGERVVRVASYKELNDVSFDDLREHSS